MKSTLLTIFIALWSASAIAQSNIETFTPSILFGVGEWEINSFHNLYSQSEARDRQGNEFNLGETQTFINALYQFTYGVSKSAWLNVGFDVMVNRAYYDSESASPFRVFSSSGDFSRTVISGIGPRVKFLPVRSLPNLSIQSSALFPIADNLETPVFVFHDRITWWTQFFYDQKINDKWRGFFEIGFLNRFPTNDAQQNFFRMPASFFINYFPSSKMSLYASIQYVPRFERISNGFDEQFGLNQWFTVLGIGGKYQATPSTSLELSYGEFIASRNDGAGYTINFGLRFIKRR